MKVRISFCTLCLGYRARAEALAEELRARFGANVEVVEGKLGQFDVTVDGQLVASRGATLLSRLSPARPPHSAAVIEAIERHVGPRDGESCEIPVPRQKSRDASGSFTASDAARFYDRFGKKQDLQFYENAAVERLLALSDFEHATAVFELGCGTGRLAERLLREHLSASARYVGVDVSATMVKLTEARLASWRDRVEVRKSDGTGRWQEGDGTCDRFVAAYVLDLLEEPALVAVLSEAHRLLASRGLLCVVALTEGVSAWSRALCSTWKAVHRLNPRLVGGCRPVRLEAFLEAGSWRVEHREVVSALGICSQVLIAARV